MSEYPKSLPLESIREIVNIVRSGDIQSQAPVFAFHVWNVQGFAQKSLLGEPDAAEAPAKPVVPPSDEITLLKSQDEIAILEAMLSDEPQAQASIPWKLVLEYLIKLLMEQLLKDA